MTGRAEGVVYIWYCVRRNFAVEGLQHVSVAGQAQQRL